MQHPHRFPHRSPLIRTLAGILTLVMLTFGLAVVPSQAALVSPIIQNDGCYEHRLLSTANNVEGESKFATLPFEVSFFGQTYGALWVNNDGNLTFGRKWDRFFPTLIGPSTPPMIAPFYADVDIRYVGRITYGDITVGPEHGYPHHTPAFCATWTDVGHYNSYTRSSKTNTFQVVLVSRPSEGPGAFDTIFNYERISWETGNSDGGVDGIGGTSAAVGYWANNGIPAHDYEHPGSFLPLSFLDTNPNGLAHTSTRTPGIVFDVTGQHIFQLVPDEFEWEVPNSLYRPYPTNHTGYSFRNRGLDERDPAEQKGYSWVEFTGIPRTELVRSEEMQQVFRDYSDYTVRNYGLFKLNNEPSLLDALASHLDGGMCYGMALSSGRFDSDLDKLHAPQSGRSASPWYHASRAYSLLSPSNYSENAAYSKEMLRLLARSHISQFSIEDQTSTNAQFEAYSRPATGFMALRQQLISALYSGRDLFDPSRNLSAPRGTGNAILAFYIDMGRTGDTAYNGKREGGWAHAVNVYSMQEEADRTLVLGISDNNAPGQPRQMRIMPDGTWTYDGSYQVLSQDANLNTLTMSLSDQGPGTSRTAITVFPLHDASNLTLRPSVTRHRGVSYAPMVVNATPGTEIITAVEENGGSVASLPVAAGPEIKAGSTTTIPNGAGRITLKGDAVLLRRTDALGAVELNSSDGAATVTTTSNTGTINLESGSARLTVARGNVLAKASNVRSLTVGATGDVSVTAASSGAQLTVSSEVAGKISTMSLITGSTQAGTTYRYSAAAITKALSDPTATSNPPAAKKTAQTDTKKKQKVKIKKFTKKAAKGTPVKINGKVNTRRGKVRLQVRRNGKWRTITTAKATRNGTFKFRTKKLKIGKSTVRILRPAMSGYRKATSRKFTIRVTKRR